MAGFSDKDSNFTVFKKEEANACSNAVRACIAASTLKSVIYDALNKLNELQHDKVDCEVNEQHKIDNLIFQINRLIEQGNHAITDALHAAMSLADASTKACANSGTDVGDETVNQYICSARNATELARITTKNLRIILHESSSN